MYILRYVTLSLTSLIRMFLILIVLIKNFRSVPLQIVPTILRKRSMRLFFFGMIGSFLIVWFVLVKERSFPMGVTPSPITTADIIL